MTSPGRRRQGDADAVDRALAAAYPIAACELHHRDAYQLLVATILSAQCTDARVNQVTPALFERWPNAAALAGADQVALEAAIRSTDSASAGMTTRMCRQVLQLPNSARHARRW